MDRDPLELVAEFHQRIHAEIGEVPRLLPCNAGYAREIADELRQLSKAAAKSTDLFARRLGMALEELSEWCQAHADGDLEAAADAWADRMYLLCGDAVAAGLPAWELLAAVHESNMTKAAGRTTDTGKGEKSGEYRPPKLTEILQEKR